MKTMFNGSDEQGCSMEEVAFKGLCNRLQRSGVKERRVNATIKSRLSM